MSPRSPYGPDRSLSIAVAVLIGGGLFVTATAYLLTTSAGHFTGRHQTQVAGGQAAPQTWSGAGRLARGSAPLAPSGAASGRARSLPPALSRVPAWAGSGTSVPPPRVPAPETYDVRPDMGHADLGPPSGAPKTGRSSADAPPVGTGGATGGVPNAGSGPLAADLGDSPSGTSTDWRSEASTLGRRARALSGALARLNRTNSAAKGSGRGGRSSAPGDESTAAADRGSNAAADPPDPPPPPPGVPVDGGLGWLAAAGAAYAANRLRKRREDDELNDET